MSDLDPSKGLQRVGNTKTKNIRKDWFMMQKEHCYKLGMRMLEMKAP